MVEHFVSLEVDEKRKHVITKITNETKVESDHNVLKSKFKISWQSSDKQEKNEIYNLKNKEGQVKFKKETSNANYLSSAFDDETEDINKSANRFIKRLNKLIHKCFNRIRITYKTDKNTDELYEKWRQLQGKDDPKAKEDLKTIESELADKIKENYNKIENETNKYDCDDGGFHSGKLWNLKKHLFPKHRDPPTAMKDDAGNLLTSSDEINELALKKLAIERLRNRPIKIGLEEMKEKKTFVKET